MFMVGVKIWLGFIFLVFPFEYGLNLVSIPMGMIGVIFVLAGIASVINLIIGLKEKTSSSPRSTDRTEQLEPNS